MPPHLGAATRADRETTVADLPRERERLDAVIGRVLDEFLAATGLQGQYTIGTSDHPPAWWLGNAHTATAERPLHIALHFDATAPRRRPSRCKSRVSPRGRRRTCTRWATCSIGKPGAACEYRTVRARRTSGRSTTAKRVTDLIAHG